MKLISWNVNGIRSVVQKGFLEWLRAEKADVVCLQEIKAFPEQVDLLVRNPSSYQSHWFSAEKPGYSGVAVYSRSQPLMVRQGIGISEIDREGRVLVVEFPQVIVINAYFPNSQRDHSRLPYKLNFCQEMLKFCEKLRRQKKHFVLCGDFNIAHREIDLKNPKTNQDNAGFLPEERAWMDEFLGAGYIDTFRHFVKDPGHYSWWSYRPGVRDKNIGWRLDYHVVPHEMESRLDHASIRPEVLGSDHCPVVLELKD